MVKGNTFRKDQRGPLFPGISCFPLSPKKTNTSENTHFLDQISIILHVIGTPSSFDPADFTSCSAKRYLDSLPYWPGIEFASKFPASSELGSIARVTLSELDLLQKMLMFSPSQRLTVDKALEHPYFTKVRNVAQELTATPVHFEFEGTQMSKKGRGYIIREIMHHNSTVLLQLSKSIAEVADKSHTSPGAGEKAEPADAAGKSKSKRFPTTRLFRKRTSVHKEDN